MRLEKLSLTLSTGWSYRSSSERSPRVAPQSSADGGGILAGCEFAPDVLSIDLNSQGGTICVRFFSCFSAFRLRSSVTSDQPRIRPPRVHDAIGGGLTNRQRPCHLRLGLKNRGGPPNDIGLIAEHKRVGSDGVSPRCMCRGAMGIAGGCGA